MGWNYRKRIRILPGVYLNISRSGLGVSVGFPKIVDKVIRKMEVNDEEAESMHNYFKKHKERTEK